MDHVQQQWIALRLFTISGDAATWALSVYYAYQRTWKPFNPILGETYEMVNDNGFIFIAEQVSDKLRGSCNFEETRLVSVKEIQIPLNGVIGVQT